MCDARNAPSVLNQLTTLDVLRAARLPLPANISRLLRCPLPGHDDGTPSFRVFARGWRCFGCGRKGGILDLAVELGFARDRAGAARWLEGRRA